MKAYKSRPRSGPFQRGIDWRAVIAEIEEAGKFGEWASPESMQGQERINSLYTIVSTKQHPVLRELAAEGYHITPATTNNRVVDGVRIGDLLLRVTKED